MNTVLIMLGSNLFPEINLKLAIEKLAAHFHIVNQSSVIVNKPIGEKYINDFHNQAIKITTFKELEDTTSILKQIEKELGRDLESKITGLISIDIDLIFWNNTLKHKDYERFYFVKKCINEIIK